LVDRKELVTALLLVEEKETTKMVALKEMSREK